MWYIIKFRIQFLLKWHYMISIIHLNCFHVPFYKNDWLITYWITYFLGWNCKSPNARHLPRHPPFRIAHSVILNPAKSAWILTHTVFTASHSMVQDFLLWAPEVGAKTSFYQCKLVQLRTASAANTTHAVEEAIICTSLFWEKPSM